MISRQVLDLGFSQPNLIFIIKIAKSFRNLMLYLITSVITRKLFVF